MYMITCIFPRTLISLVVTIIAFDPAFAESPWVRSEQIDPMTDDTQIYYSTFSVDPLQCGFSPVRARLYLTCESGAIAIMSTGGCVFEDANVFSYRVDDNSRSYISTGSLATGQPVRFSDVASMRPTAPNFIEELLSGVKLLIEIRPFATQAEIVEFDISGLDQVVTDEFKSCFPQYFPSQDQQSSDQNAQTETPLFGNSGLLTPFSAESIQNQIMEQLSCDEPPNPSELFAALREEGMVSFDQNLGYDSMSCFKIVGDLQMPGLTFNSICGFEEDESVRARYPGLYNRGPGTSPGQFVSFGVSAPEATVMDWYSTNFGPVNTSRAVSSRYPNLGDTTDIVCNTWILEAAH